MKQPKIGHREIFKTYYLKTAVPNLCTVYIKFCFKKYIYGGRECRYIPINKRS